MNSAPQSSRKSAAEVLESACEKLTAGLVNEAAEIVRRELPFLAAERISRRRTRTLNNDRLLAPLDPYTVLATRNYRPKELILLFLHDGFLDEYTGERLICPAALRAISVFLPAEFPYHKNWKFSECHAAYWDLCATVDHVIPITLGGADARTNWVTTSMTNNLVKGNLTPEEVNWNRRPRTAESTRAC